MLTAVFRFIGGLEDDDAPAEPEKAANSTSPRKRALAIWAFSAAATAVVVAAVLYTIITFSGDPSPVTRFTVVIPSAQTIEAGAYQSVAISPAATHLAYIANGRIYLRARDAVEARPVAGTEDQGPLLGVLFSPDSRWIGFYSSRHRELRKVPISGGIPVRMGSAEGYLGGSWAADGRVIFAHADGVYAVRDAGGEPELLVAVQRAHGERAQNPVLLPGGRVVLFTLVTDSGAQRHIAVQSLQRGSRRILIANGTDGRYVDTGHLVFADAGTLMVSPFDVRTLQTSGPPSPVAQGLLAQSVIRSADFVISQNGALVYRAVARPLRALVWVGRDGAQEAVGAPSLPYGYAARVSPDGAKIAMTVDDEESELFVWDIASRTFTRLTFNPGAARMLPQRHEQMALAQTATKKQQRRPNDLIHELTRMDPQIRS